jgi:dolichol-phosphate mannosyltransferase
MSPTADLRDGVLIILPVLNEVENIDRMLDGIEKELHAVQYTVCIIDDGSVDGTLERIHQAQREATWPIHLIQRQKTGRGSQRGSALRAGLEWGLRHTGHTVFVEMDGDLSHRPEELARGIALVERDGWNVAIASKYVYGSITTNRPLRRRLVSRISSIAVGTVITRRIRDYSNGYRFYDRVAAEVLHAHRWKFGSPIYLTEALAIWLHSGLRVVEFPTMYVGRNEGLSKLRVVDLLKAGLAVFEIGWRYHIVGFAKQTPVSSDHTDVVPAPYRRGTELSQLASPPLDSAIASVVTDTHEPN